MLCSWKPQTFCYPKSYLFCDIKLCAKFQNPRTTPSGRKVCGPEKKERKIPNIVDTAARSNAQGHRTHSARTKSQNNWHLGDLRNLFYKAWPLCFPDSPSGTHSGSGYFNMMSQPIRLGRVDWMNAKNQLSSFIGGGVVRLHFRKHKKLNQFSKQQASKWSVINIFQVTLLNCYT